MEEEIEEEASKSPIHFLAGALAGTAEHCGMYPVDNIKTHIQAHNQPSYGVVDACRTIFRSGGLMAFFRGVTAVALSAAPAHAIYFSSYEHIKTKLADHIVLAPFAFGIAGAVATILSDGVLTPMDTVKQRRQLNLKAYTGTWNCFTSILRQEGVSALYAGYTTTLTMNVPFHMIYLNSYEVFRGFLIEKFNKEKALNGGSGPNLEGTQQQQHATYDPKIDLIAGGAAGTVASGLTNPLDVAKTRLQTQGDVFVSQPCTHHPHHHAPHTYVPHTTSSTTSTTTPHHDIKPVNQMVTSGRHYHGMVNTLSQIWKDEGVRGYTRGILPRMVFFSFSASILFTTYQYTKFILGADKYEQQK
eukprot:TRINITY_DN1859_c0_g1_i1.p1 TRINITY_DN1859_c0_g1~~TRINITY_DN1859_c0_g1_i1.p1  ORF type:complete len:358 (-),score=74.75 TRINITY_DN1859_c0_g1_i1:320-1393(-)